MAFGKCMRIANAITDLRRFPSFEYSDHQLSPTQLHHFNSRTHPPWRTRSQSQSLPGMSPATTVGRVRWNSFGSPEARHDGRQSGHSQDSSMNVNDDIKAAGSVADVAAGMSAAAGIGLGSALSPMNKPPEVSSINYLWVYLCINFWVLRRDLLHDCYYYLVL
jgi:hypothetical protein